MLSLSTMNSGSSLAEGRSFDSQETIANDDRNESTDTTKVEEKRFPILIVGNLLSKSNGVRSVCEDLSLQFERNGWEVYKASTKLGRLQRIADMVLTAIRYRKLYDVAQVNVYSGSAFIWAETVCWTLHRLGKPIVLTLHGGNLPNFAERWPGRVRRLLSSACFVTTPSHYLLEHMTPYCDRIQKLPNAIDLTCYQYLPRAAPSPKLVWLRSFHQIYNPTLAIRVLNILRQEFPDIELKMIGPDKGDGSFNETQELISQFDLGSQVELVGRVPKEDVPRWLNKADILLNTTNFDNTPVSLLEAMACGVCIVTTNVGGIPYLVQHEETALLVPPNDPEAMAAAVTRCLHDHKLASHLSACGRQTVEAFDWPVVLQYWKSILASARAT